MDMPTDYGSHKTAWRRLKKFEGKLNLERASVDSTIAEAKKGGNLWRWMGIIRGKGQEIAQASY